MKKIVTLLLIAVVGISCSKDEAVIQNDQESNAILSITKYDSSNLGLYKGTFAAIDSKSRGLVKVELTTGLTRASVLLEDNTELKFTGHKNLNEGANNDVIHFTSELGTFDFTVNADGTSPKVMNAKINNQEGGIVLVKETSRAPVTAITGTFGCFDCPEHPFFGNPDNANNLTWNTIFQGDGTGADIITTQVSFGPRTAVNTGFQNDPYITLGDYSLCEVGGSASFGEAATVEWTGTHTYTTSRDCSSLLGAWRFQSSVYDIVGWIQSDERCFEL